MAGIHDKPKPAFDFEANDVCVEHGAARRAGRFRGSHRRGNQSTTGMRHRNKAHVIVVVCVRSDSVSKRSIRRACKFRGAQYSALAPAFRHDRSTNDARRSFRSARENDANRVAQCDRRPMPRFGWREARGDEIRQGMCDMNHISNIGLIN